jgi:hypothetical protein
MGESNCTISNGSCTVSVIPGFQDKKPVIDPINCTDPQAAASPYTAVGEKIEFDLGTFDSQGSPYKIKINLDNGYWAFTISIKPLPVFEGFYYVQKPLHNDSFIEANLDSSFYGFRTIKYDFVSPKGSVYSNIPVFTQNLFNYLLH